MRRIPIEGILGGTMNMSKKVIGIVLVVIGILLFGFAAREERRMMSMEMEDQPTAQFSRENMMKAGGIVLILAGIGFVVAHHKKGPVHVRHHRKAPARRKARKR